MHSVNVKVQKSGSVEDIKVPQFSTPKCKVIRRNGRVMVICPANPKHKQRQG